MEWTDLAVLATEAEEGYTDQKRSQGKAKRGPFPRLRCIVCFAALLIFSYACWGRCGDNEKGLAFYAACPEDRDPGRAQVLSRRCKPRRHEASAETAQPTSQDCSEVGTTSKSKSHQTASVGEISHRNGETPALRAGQIRERATRIEGSHIQDPARAGQDGKRQIHGRRRGTRLGGIAGKRRRIRFEETVDSSQSAVSEHAEKARHHGAAAPSLYGQGFWHNPSSLGVTTDRGFPTECPQANYSKDGRAEATRAPAKDPACGAADGKGQREKSQTGITRVTRLKQYEAFEDKSLAPEFACQMCLGLLSANVSVSDCNVNFKLHESKNQSQEVNYEEIGKDTFFGHNSFAGHRDEPVPLLWPFTKFGPFFRSDTGRQHLLLSDISDQIPLQGDNLTNSINRATLWRLVDNACGECLTDSYKLLFESLIGLPLWCVLVSDLLILLYACVKTKAHMCLYRLCKRNHRIGRCRFCVSRRTNHVRRHNHFIKQRVLCFLWLILATDAIDPGCITAGEYKAKLNSNQQEYPINDQGTSPDSPLHASSDPCELNETFEMTENLGWNFLSECLHRNKPPPQYVPRHGPDISEVVLQQDILHDYATMVHDYRHPLVDDFCGNLCGQFGTAIRAAIQTEHWISAPFTCDCIRRLQIQVLVEHTKTFEDSERQRSDDFTLMQMTSRSVHSNALCHETCGIHLDPTIYWDRISIATPIVSTSFFVWLTDPHVAGLQTHLHRIPWNGRDCICCAFVAAVPQAISPTLRGPFLVRPQPQNLDGTQTLNFIAMTSIRQEHQRVLHVQVASIFGRRSGTVVIDTLYGITNVPALFDTVRPEHRCRIDSWCRAIWRAQTQTFVIWWPSAFTAVDYSHVELDEIGTNQQLVIGNAQMGPTPTSINQHQSTSSSLPVCPDSGTTEYEQDGNFLTTWSRRHKPIPEDVHDQDRHPSTDDFGLQLLDAVSFMHMPRADADRSHSSSPDRMRGTRQTDSSDSSPTNIPSTEASENIEALVIFGTTIEPALIPLLDGQDSEQYKFVVQDFLEIPRGSTEALDLTVHAIVPKPKDLAECVTPLMVLQGGQHAPNQAAILVDIEMYSTETDRCDTEDKRTYFAREPWIVPTEMARYELATRLGVTELCHRHRENSCLFFIGQHPWPIQDPYRYPMTNGLFVSVKIPVAIREVPLSMCLHYARNGVPFSQMAERWRQPPRTILPENHFDTDDETLLRDIHAVEPEMHEDDDMTTLLATNRVRTGPPAHLMYPPTILIYSRIFGNLNFQIDPALPLRRFREAIGDLLDINRNNLIWNNYLLFRVIPPPTGVDIFHQEPYVIALPEELIHDFSFILVDLHYIPDEDENCAEQTKFRREVFRIQTRSSRKSFLQSLMVFELCLITGHDLCEVNLQEIYWHPWEDAPRYLLDGASAEVKIHLAFPHIPIDQQIAAAQQGMTHQHMTRLWSVLDNANTFLLQYSVQILTQTAKKFHRSPVEGLRPPGNPVELDALDDVDFIDGEYRIVDSKTRTIQLHGLLNLPTPCRNRSSTTKPTLAKQEKDAWNSHCLGHQLQFFYDLLDFDPLNEQLQLNLGEDMKPPDCVISWLKEMPIIDWPTWDPMTATEFRFHTDGSYNGQLSSWAFCCTVLIDTDWHFLGYQHGISCPLGTAHFRHTALTGELQAILWASFWALRYFYLLQWNGKISFHWDAIVAGRKASGDYANAQDVLSRTVRHVQQGLETFLGNENVCHQHTRAHTGIQENELADFLAKKAIELKLDNTNITAKLSTFFENPDATLQWLWWHLTPTFDTPVLPEYTDGNIRWQSRSDAEFDADFIVRTTIFPCKPTSTTDMNCVHFELQIGTYNCLSLGEKPETQRTPGLHEIGRIAFIRNKAMELGYHLVGIQEARTSHGMVRSHSFTRFCSGKTPDGTLGVELWVSMVKPYCYDSDGKPFYFQPQDFAVVHSDPRLLVVNFSTQLLSFIVVVGHAPHSGTELRVRNEWWDTLHELLQPVQNHEGIFLLDANARVAAAEDAHFGDIRDGFTDHAAENLRTFASIQQVYAPATFSSCHTGPIATWMHPAYDFAARIDYVLLPLQWKSAQILSWTDPYLNSGHAVIDHICAAISIQWATWKMAPKNEPKGFDRNQIAEPSNRETVCQILQNIPQVPWQTNASQPIAEITDYLQQSLREAFPYKPKKRPPVGASDEAQSLFLQLTYAKRQMRSYDELRKTHLLQWIFDTWTNRKQQTSDDSWSKHFCRMLAEWTKKVPHLSKQLRETLKRDRAAFIQKVADAAATCNAQDVYRMLRPLVQPKRKTRQHLQPMPQVLKLDGTLTTSAHEVCERWEEHFSLLEAGRPTDPCDLVTDVIRRQQQTRLPANWNTSDIPSLSALEDAFRRSKPQRAPGPDMLPPDIMKVAPGLLASKLYPLLLKQCLRLEEPASSKGGKLVRIYKGRGAFNDCGNHRGILLMNVLGKALRSSCRAIINAPYAQNTLDLQLGGKPSAQVLYGSQAVRHFLAWGRTSRTTTAVIFCDVAAAYYRALRELTLGFGSDTPDVETLATRLGLHPDLIPNLTAALNDTAYGSLGPSDPQNAYLQEGLSGTWFHMGAESIDGHCISTNRGSRPGDAWADTIFNALFSSVLTKLSDGLKQAGIDFEIQVPANMNPFHLVPSEQMTNIFQTTWADDLAVLLRIADSTRIEPDLSTAASILLDALKSYGMEATIGAGKTAALVLVRGAHSVAVRRKIFAEIDPHVVVLQESDAPVKLPLITRYKHLGGILDSNCNMFGELVARATKAKSAYWRIAKSVFRHKATPMKTKCQIFKATVLAVLLWGSGSWPALTQTEFDFFTRTVWEFYRLLLPRFDRHGLVRYSHFDILTILQLPHPDDLLPEARCRHYGTMIATAPPQLWALFALDTRSQQAYCEAFKWCWSAVEHDGHLPHFSNWDSWEQMMKTAPIAWKNTVKKAGRRHLWKRLRLGFVAQWESFLVTSLQEQHLIANLRPPSGQQHCCLICNKAFGQKRSWFLHSYSKHGYLSRHGQAAQGRYCPRCEKLYRSEQSLSNHLRYSRPCCDFFWHCRSETIEQPDQQIGHPQCPWIPLRFGPRIEDVPEPVDEKRQLVLDLRQTLLEFVPPADEADFVGQLRDALQQTCTRVMPYPDICAAVEEWTTSLGHDYDPILYEAITLLQQWINMPREDSQPSYVGTSFDFADVKILPALRRGSLRCEWRPRELLFLHLCSGRRRTGDLQTCLEKLSINEMLTVVSVDIAIDPNTCDLLCPKQCERWVSMAFNGEFIGAGIGPPCESWSIARFHQLSSEQSTAHQPRPIRRIFDLWGQTDVSWKEHVQLDTGNRLLAVGLNVVLGQAINGYFSFLEHPDDPRLFSWAHKDAPTIWATRPLDWCSATGLFIRLRTQQGHFGAKSPKPTCLLVSGLAESEAKQVEFELRTHPLPSTGSIGRQGNGWATSSLKEYPSNFCAMLAEMFHRFYSSVADLPQRSSKEDLQWIHRLCMDIDQAPRRQTPGPDFAGGGARLIR